MSFAKNALSNAENKIIFVLSAEDTLFKKKEECNIIYLFPIFIFNFRNIFARETLNYLYINIIF
jgi:hypothetical protein